MNLRAVRRAAAWPSRLEAGQLGEGEVEVLADRLVFLLLAQQFVCIDNNIPWDR